jgi:hypothetical protein
VRVGRSAVVDEASEHWIKRGGCGAHLISTTSISDAGHAGIDSDEVIRAARIKRAPHIVGDGPWVARAALEVAGHNRVIQDDRSGINEESAAITDRVIVIVRVVIRYCDVGQRHCT